MQECQVETDSEDELPAGWEERISSNGIVHYVNIVKNNIQWNHPRTNKMKKVPAELPFGWTKKIGKDGKVTFVNEMENREISTDPRLAFSMELSSDKIRQMFDSSTKAASILYGKDLTGKVALITGASSGIGYETARSLSNFGCEIIFACRNEELAIEKIQYLRSENKNAKLEFIQIDLSSIKSCKRFCDEVKLIYGHIDYLILNAGVFGLPYTLTCDGLETTFQVCHLSHFYITQQLLELLNEKTRVLVVSSESHRFSNLPSVKNLTRDILSPPVTKYRSMLQYNNVKLCNILFAFELARRVKDRGISVFALHPGNLVSTNIQRNWWFYKVLFLAVKPFTKTLQQAASTTIYCCVADELNGLSGLYFNNCYICQSKLSQNENLAKELWNVSEEIINEILGT